MKGTARRIGLVGCVKQKAFEPLPAAQLYTSTLFIGRAQYVRRTCDEWFILSALYGVVDPETVLAPYDVTLTDASPARRREWSQNVLDELRERLGNLDRYQFELHAGASYRDFGLVDGLRASGAVVTNPTEGLGLGRQLAFYAKAGPTIHHTPLASATIENVVPIGSFDYKWPSQTEHFESGWTYRLLVEGEAHDVRHGLGGREVYGRERVHTVTWVDGQVRVEGVEADDYPGTGCLISLLRHPDKTMIRDVVDVPVEYSGFEVVNHRQEIEAKGSPSGLTVKIAADDLLAWGTHAWLRQRQGGGRSNRGPRPRASAETVTALPPAAASKKGAVVKALLAHGKHLAEALGGGAARFTVDDDANAMIHADPFAFLVAVIADQGIKAELAWAIPYELKGRLGAFSPSAFAVDPDGVRQAFARPPKLHRFVNQVADWIIDAAAIVIEQYGGDASVIWGNGPSAADLRARFDAFPGIGQKKAAMAVEILERSLGVRISDLAGSDVAYDIHLRRVFLRSGLADVDDRDHMVAAARALHPKRPGALDNPAWDIGRRWCTAQSPDCASCPLVTACPRLIARGSVVRGIS